MFICFTSFIYPKIPSIRPKQAKASVFVLADRTNGGMLQCFVRLSSVCNVCIVARRTEKLSEDANRK